MTNFRIRLIAFVSSLLVFAIVIWAALAARPKPPCMSLEKAASVLSSNRASVDSDTGSVEINNDVASVEDFVCALSAVKRPMVLFGKGVPREDIYVVLRKMQNVAELDVETIGLEEPDVDEELLSLILGVPGIKSVYFKNVKFQDDLLNSTKQSNVINALTVRYPLSPAVFPSILLNRFPNLTHLSIEGGDLEDDFFPNLEGQSNMESLYLRYIDLEKNELKLLPDLPRLRELGLYGAGNIGESSIKHISEYRSLEFLDLGCVDVSDSSAKHLGKLKRLKHLMLISCFISQDAVDSLEEELPNTKISFP